MSSTAGQGHRDEQRGGVDHFPDAYSLGQWEAEVLEMLDAIEAGVSREQLPSKSLSKFSKSATNIE